MYPLRPVVALPSEIPLPDNMYSLPRVQGETTRNAQFTEDGFELVDDEGRQEIDPHINEVEFRQMKLLRDLCDVRGDIEALGIAIRISDVVKPKPIYPSKTIKNPITADIVVFAHPLSPPYSILALQRLWRETKFNIKCHHHSTAPVVAGDDFLNKALGKTMYVPAHHVDVVIIWKDVKDIQLVPKAYDYPFNGEANILRYLSRLLEESYRFENPSTVAETNAMDSIMDLCSHLFYEEPKSLDDVATKIASYLGKNPWLVNLPKPSIADVTAWSALKRLQYKITTPALRRWFDECEKSFLKF